MNKITIGQRFVSLGEPGLGMGLVSKKQGRHIYVQFPSADVERCYMSESMPLDRVTFQTGELIRKRSGQSLRVQAVEEHEGLFFYQTEEGVIRETELCDTGHFSHPDQQFLNGKVFPPKSFMLRLKTWQLQNASLKAPWRGFLGPAIQLLPHQLYIAQQVSSNKPRALLSDEVGLGKTIEAGLIFHRLYVTGYVRRVLILAPGPLVFQWFTEFYRKFNVLFSLMDPDLWEGCLEENKDINPYQQYQLIIQDLDLLTSEHDRVEAILESKWDLVIVDEAHHLHWNEKNPSKTYIFVEALSKKTSGLLLLTATPHQLGLEEHFGRLKLLDPVRFSSFHTFLEETKQYRELAAVTTQLEETQCVSQDIIRKLCQLYSQDANLKTKLEQYQGSQDKTEIEAIISALVDRHGTSRVLYRNTRKQLSDDKTGASMTFPNRVVNPIPLKHHQNTRFPLHSIHEIDDVQYQLSQIDMHPDRIKIIWLIEFLKARLEKKHLLICSHIETVKSIQSELVRQPKLKIAIFTEAMTLLERDRQAAYFAEEKGAQVLLCSEIGTEGRNFQFAQDLILFDLPLHPDRLEQRIGRLDRLGQQKDIHLHIPYLIRSPQDLLFKWYHQGLDAFQTCTHSREEAWDHFGSSLLKNFNQFDGPAFQLLLHDSHVWNEETRAKLEAGRDRLVERNSFNKEKVEALMQVIEQEDSKSELEEYMGRVLDHFGVKNESLGNHGYFIKPTSHMFVESFPSLTQSGMSATYSREMAIKREEFSFLSYDHPLVQGAMDLIIHLDRGKTSFSIWASAPGKGLAIHAVYILESVISDEFDLVRFMPPTPVEVLIDQKGNDLSGFLPQLHDAKLRKGPTSHIETYNPTFSALFKHALPVSKNIAMKRAENIKKESKRNALALLNLEIERLHALNQVNPQLAVHDLGNVKTCRSKIETMLDQSEVRLDALNVLVMTP